jgi:hypothetical protein
MTAWFARSRPPGTCNATLDTNVIRSGFLFCDSPGGHDDDFHHDPLDGRWKVVSGMLTVRPDARRQRFLP